MNENDWKFQQLVAIYFNMLLNANGIKSLVQWNTNVDNGNALDFLRTAENMANFQLANAVSISGE